jgi:hypothetical protein
MRNRGTLFVQFEAKLPRRANLISHAVKKKFVVTSVIQSK